MTSIDTLSHGSIPATTRNSGRRRKPVILLGLPSAQRSDPTGRLVDASWRATTFAVDLQPHPSFINSSEVFAKFETWDMASQHEEADFVRPGANPASSTSGSGTFLKTTSNASVRAASIHNTELGDGSDAENISYRVYGDPGRDRPWEDIMERKGLVRTILSMNPLAVDHSLEELENRRKFSTKILTECLWGRPGAGYVGWELEGWERNNVRVLSLESDEDVFMVDSPDSHFIVQKAASISSDWYEQSYSFRFPSLSHIHRACRLSWLFFSDGPDDQIKGHYVRGTITGAAHDECCEMFEPGEFKSHPWMLVMRLFRYIDRAHNRPDLVECIQRLQNIEDKLQHPELDSLGALTIDLNTLNTKISKLRTCVRYIKVSMESMFAINDAGGWKFDDGNNRVSRIIRRSWNDLETDVASLQKMCEQRLLDMESVQQRIDISLSVVSNLLAQKENEWNRNMARSQKTIAMLTMFFLPATFFAILFTLPLFNWDPSKGPVLTDKLWIYWTFTVPLTVLLFLCYFLWVHVKQLLYYLRRNVSVDRRFPFWHLGKKGKEGDLEMGTVGANGGRKEKTKTG